MNIKTLVWPELLCHFGAVKSEARSCGGRIQVDFCPFFIASRIQSIWQSHTVHYRRLKGAKFKVIPCTQKAEARRSRLQDQPVLQNPEVCYFTDVYIWGHSYRTKSIK